LTAPPARSKEKSNRASGAVEGFAEMTAPDAVKKAQKNRYRRGSTGSSLDI
jgi:hypothetical protein